MLTNVHKHVPDIMGDGFRGRNMVFRSPCFHEALESPDLHYLEGSFTLCDPTYDFGPTSIEDEVEEKFQKVSILPSFQGGMLTMRIGDFFFSHMFKLGHNGPVTQLRFQQHQSCSLQVLGTICSHHSIITPAVFGMPTKPAGGFGITSVQELADIVPILPSTSSSSTLNTWTRRPLTYSTWGSFLKET